MTFLEDIRGEIHRAGIDRAIARRDTAVIFDWLLTAFSYQGVSDQVARTYMRRNGGQRGQGLSAAFEAAPACARLRSYCTMRAADTTKAVSAVQIPIKSQLPCAAPSPAQRSPEPDGSKLFSLCP